jgi:WD40 repeat protein
MVLSIVAGTYDHRLFGFETTTAKRGGSKSLDVTADTSFQEESASDAAASAGAISFRTGYSYAAHGACVKCVATSRKWIVSGSTDESIRLFHAKEKKEFGGLFQHTGAVTCVDFGGGAQTLLISGSEDGTLCVWRTKDWECLKILKGHRYDCLRRL